MTTRTIGDIADEVLAAQVAVKKQELILEQLEEEAKKLREELRKEAEKQGLTSGGGKTSKFAIELQTLPQISNIDAFYAYIKSKDFFHLLQRRPAVKACQELWGQGVAIPGIDKFSQNKVTVKGV